MAKADRDPIDDALRIVRRRADLIPMAFLGFILALVVPVWLAAPPPMQSTALANFSLILLLPLALFLVGRVGVRRMRAGLEKIRPSVRELKVASFRGIVFVMDDGLFVQSLGSLTILSVFFDASGEPLLPTVSEGIRWTRPLRWKRELIVRPRQRADPATVGLVKIRDACGAATADASVSQFSSSATETNPPSRMASISLGRPFVGVPHDRIVAAQVSEYLRELARTDLSSRAEE